MVGNARGDRCLMDDPTTAPGEQHKTELLLLLTKLISEQAGKKALVCFDVAWDDIAKGDLFVVNDVTK